MAMLLNLLCSIAAHAAILRPSLPLTTVPNQPLVRVGQPSMHIPYEPDGRSWARGDEFNAAYRARRRAASRRSQPQSSAAHFPHPTSHAEPSELVMESNMALVLIFDMGSPYEGVYTQMQPDGSPSILTFECHDDANRFAQLLLDKGFDLPMPQYWPRSRLKTFLINNKDLAVFAVPRGTTPEAPSERIDLGEPGRERAPRPDAYTSHRLWLEQLMGMEPDNCGDDDCILG